MHKPTKTKCWEAFLKYHGYEHNKRTKGSHAIWEKSRCRPIPVWGAKNEIPAMHIRSSCLTIGCTVDSFYKWADENC